MMEIPIICYYLTGVIPIVSDGHWINLNGRILIGSGGPGYSLVSSFLLWSDLYHICRL